jgi:outer membrane biosynthesis protein TonB
MNQMKMRATSSLIGVAVVALAVTVATRSGRAEPAAGDCLSQPGGTAPQGSHWYYRTDRSANRRCWYMAPQREKAKEAREVAPAKPQPPSRPIAEPKAEPPAEPLVRTATPVPYVPMPSQSIPAPAAAIEPEPAPAAAIEPEPAPSVDRDADRQPAAPPQRQAAQQHDRPSMQAVASADDPDAVATSDLRLEHMLALIAAALALAALIVRKVFKLFTVRRLRRRRSLLRSHWEAASPTPAPVASAFADMVAVHHADVDPDATRLANIARMPAASRNLSRAIAERDVEIGDIEATLQRMVHDLRRAAA